MSFEDMLRAHDNEDEDDYVYSWPLSDDEKGEQAENEAQKRADRESDL